MRKIDYSQKQIELTLTIYKVTTMKVEQAILYNRNYLMGIAMLLVLLYHFTCWIGFRKLLLPFNWGFIGVDIFLFLSAIGLGFSASKRTYKDFLRLDLLG